MSELSQPQQVPQQVPQQPQHQQPQLQQSQQSQSQAEQSAQLGLDQNEQAPEPSTSHSPKSEQNQVPNQGQVLQQVSNQVSQAPQQVSQAPQSNSQVSLPTSHESTPTPASAVEGGRETSKKILYVGSLHKSVSEELLKSLFSVAGNIQSVKILNDKNRAGFNYAFVEFENNQAADMALHTLNGRIINNAEIKINWAFQSSTINSASRPDEPSFNIFVGDLSPEVDDEILSKSFSKFQSLTQAHVMWDMQTSRSRGYGFVTFGHQADAELALQTMNGEWISGRAIRCNWASHKQLNHGGIMRNNRQHINRGQYRPFNNNLVQQQMGHNGINGLNGQYSPQIPPNNGMQAQQQQIHQNPIPNIASPNGNLNQNINQGNNQNIPVMSPQSYDIVLRQTPSWQTTVYLGNIAHYTQQTDLIPLLQNFGFIVDFKFHPERGCAFVKYDSHERAALAIVQLAGFNINGRPLKCGWGKDRPPMGQFQNYRAPMYQR